MHNPRNFRMSRGPHRINLSQHHHNIPESPKPQNIEGDEISMLSSDILMAAPEIHYTPDSNKLESFFKKPPQIP